ncbi:MAG TPA: MauE/DoxX family redox-associated membrane protein [Pedobacter sp.]|nr:MauE/DoxX family redox-associated membrane protein [Pedobacter sp.]
MGTNLRNRQSPVLTASLRLVIFDFICYLFVALFIYTGSSKLADTKAFEAVLIRYPLIGGYSGFIAYTVPLVEFAVSLLLIVPKTRRHGLKVSLFVMIAFLLYIMYLFLSKSELPCSCGGILAKLTWQQHLWFNAFFVILALLGIMVSRK